MPDYQLHFITDDRLDHLPELILTAIESGVTLVQLRNKNASKLALYEVGKKILTITRNKKIPFIVNDHIDVALALNADGVHIGQTDLPYHAVRNLLGKNKIVGLSIQTVMQANNAIDIDADYFGVGPIFSTQTKSDVIAIGLEALTEITQILPKPCIAIGGIKSDDVKNILSHGAQGIAVVSGICGATDPAAAVHRYVSALNEP